MHARECVRSKVRVDTKGEKRKKTRKEEERIEGEKQLPLNARELTSLRRKLEISHSSDVPSVESEEKKKRVSLERRRERGKEDSPIRPSDRDSTCHPSRNPIQPSRDGILARHSSQGSPSSYASVRLFSSSQRSRPTRNGRLVGCRRDVGG